MKSAKIQYLKQAKRDLIEGYWFYEQQQTGLGARFLECICADIETLRDYAGTHRKIHRDYFRLLSKRFPYAVFYKVSNRIAYISVVADCRRDPGTILKKLD